MKNIELLYELYLEFLENKNPEKLESLNQFTRFGSGFPFPFFPILT